MKDLRTKELVRKVRQDAALVGDALFVELCNDYLIKGCKQAYYGIVSNQLNLATREVFQWIQPKGQNTN